MSTYGLKLPKSERLRLLHHYDEMMYLLMLEDRVFSPLRVGTIFEKSLDCCSCTADICFWPNEPENVSRKAHNFFLVQKFFHFLSLSVNPPFYCRHFQASSDDIWIIAQSVDVCTGLLFPFRVCWLLRLR